MDHPLPQVHGNARPAEAAAALVVAPYVANLQQQIAGHVVARADEGLTPDEFQQATGALINTVRRRFTDLWKAGKIRPTERTRNNRRGHPETVWVDGRDPQLVASRETKDQQITRLAAHVRMLVVEGERLKGRLWYHAEHPHTHSYSENCGCESCAVTRAYDALAEIA